MLREELVRSALMFVGFSKKTLGIPVILRNQQKRALLPSISSDYIFKFHHVSCSDKVLRLIPQQLPSSVLLV